MSIRIECILDCGNHLGEGPVWDVDEGRLYWVDGTGRRVGKPELWRLDPRSGRVENWTLGEHDVGRNGAPRRRRRGDGARRRLLLLRLRQGGAGADRQGRRRPAAHPPQRRQVRPARALFRRRDGRQGGAHHLRPVAARPRPLRHQGGGRHHLHQRPLLEPRRPDLLPRRQLPGGVLGLRLRHRDRHACQQAGVRHDEGRRRRRGRLHRGRGGLSLERPGDRRPSWCATRRTARWSGASGCR